MTKLYTNPYQRPRMLFLLLLLSQTPTAILAKNQNLMSTPPKRNEWKAFLEFSKVEHQQLWRGLRGKGQKMSTWSWGWRIAWVRACLPHDMEGHCLEIATQGSIDKAAVVRAEVAKYLGRKIEKLRSNSIEKHIKILKAIYHHPKNFRNGKPLIVPYKVLEALSGSPYRKAQKTGEVLAKSHPLMEKFWKKVTTKG